jgi:hypothetical protein
MKRSLHYASLKANVNVPAWLRSGRWSGPNLSAVSIAHEIGHYVLHHPLGLIEFIKQVARAGRFGGETVDPSKSMLQSTNTNRRK